MMRWIHIIIISVFLNIAGIGQEWFPVGAIWHYSQTHFWPPMETSSQFQVISETQIQGKNCKLIQGACNCAPDLGNIVCQEGDTVFRYNLESDSFTILYDFSLQSGDTLTFSFEGFDPTYYLLDSVSQVFLNGIPIRVQHLSWIDGNSVAIGLKNYEYIGNDGCFYPQVGVCDPLTGGLRCYEDSVFGLQKFSGFNLDCSAVISSQNNSSPQSVNFYPNPANNYLTIETSGHLAKIELFDFWGQSIVVKKQPDWPIINLGEIPSGLYVVKLTFFNQQSFIGRLSVIR